MPKGNRQSLADQLLRRVVRFADPTIPAPVYLFVILQFLVKGPDRFARLLVDQVIRRRASPAGFAGLGFDQHQFAAIATGADLHRRFRWLLFVDFPTVRIDCELRDAKGDFMHAIIGQRRQQYAGTIGAKGRFRHCRTTGKVGIVVIASAGDLPPWFSRHGVVSHNAVGTRHGDEQRMVGRNAEVAIAVFEAVPLKGIGLVGDT